VAIQTVPSLWLYGALLFNRRRQQSCVMDQAASAVDFIRSSQLDDRKFRKFSANTGSERCDTTIWWLDHAQTEKISSHQKIILQGKKKIPLSASNNIE